MSARSLDDTAASVGLSGSRFRRVWKTWARRFGFPMPFRSPATGGHYAWDGEAVDRWTAARSEPGAALAPPPSAHRPRPGYPSAGQVALERARLDAVRAAAPRD